MWEAAALVVRQGWPVLALPALDKLLAISVLERSGATATVAALILKTSVASIQRVFPPPHDPQHLYNCALHALQNVGIPDQLNLSFDIYVDIERSQASLFFGEEVGAAPVLLFSK